MRKDAQVLALARQDRAGAQRTEANVSQGLPTGSVPYPILADPDGAVAQAYGVANASAYDTPAVFVIDAQGKVLWREIAVQIDNRPGALEILNHVP